jgi:hypothetical protein
MARTALLFFCLTVACFKNGPATPTAQEALRKTAAFDLSCEEASLDVKQITGECHEGSWNNCTMGVRGCGGSVRYIYFGKDTWVANTQSTPK